MSISFDARAVVAPDVMFRHVGDESVILDLKTERYLGLDEVGTRMWNVVLDSPSIESAYETLAAEYDVDPARLRRELKEFLHKLVDHGLIAVAAETTNP